MKKSFDLENFLNEEQPTCTGLKEHEDEEDLWESIRSESQEIIVIDDLTKEKKIKKSPPKNDTINDETMQMTGMWNQFYM